METILAGVVKVLNAGSSDGVTGRLTPAARARRRITTRFHRSRSRYVAAVRAPVLLVHGWGSSFERTWVATGVSALLEDAGRTVIGVDLLGHGAAPKPHDPEAYRDLTGRLVEALPAAGPADAVGFSLGAITLLELACRQPELFGRLVLAGIGANVFERDAEGTRRIVAGIRRPGPRDRRAGARLPPLRRAARQRSRQRSSPCSSRPPSRSPRSGWRPSPARCWSRSATGTSPVRRIASSAALPDARLAILRNTRPLRHARVLRVHRRHARVPRRRPVLTGRRRRLTPRCTRRSTCSAPAGWWPSRPRPSTGSGPTPPTRTPWPAGLRGQGTARRPTRSSSTSASAAALASLGRHDPARRRDARRGLLARSADDAAATAHPDVDPTRHRRPRHRRAPSAGPPAGPRAAARPSTVASPRPRPTGSAG